MGHRRFALACVSALTLSALTIAAPGLASPGAEGGLDIQPGGVAAGMTVTVSGDGFDGDCDVLLFWGSAEGPLLGTAAVEDGSFLAEVTVPADAGAGKGSIEARGRQHDTVNGGCGAESGTADRGSVNVSAGASQKGRTISLLARTINAPGIDQATLASAKASGRGVHAIVQLHSLPRAGDLEVLAELGVTPLAYLNAKDGSGSAYLASISPGVRNGDARFGALVRGVHRLLPQDKIATELAASNGPPTEGLLALVMFFADVPTERALAILASVGATPVADHGLGVFGVSLNRGQVQRLATIDEVQFISEAPAPGQYDLDNSRTLHNVDALQNFNVPAATYLGLSGFGVQVSIHDSGVDDHHGDFAGRMIRTLHPGQGGDHGTHVASIAAGSGVMSDQDDDNGNPNMGTPYQWRGMAPQAGISAFDSQTGDDVGTMTTAIVTDGVDVSNHSYSYNDGQYDATMVNIDSIIRGDAGIPARPQVFSAGNQGVGKQYGENSGYFSLTKSCKNCIMVANLQDNGVLNGGSSHGPTPDGRVKPDLGANGSGVIAAGADVHDGQAPPGDDTGNSYRSKGGTSMATPAVTGIVALLLQQYAAQFGVNLDTHPPLPSTMRAMLVHTAVDQTGTASGTNPDTGTGTRYGPGPDWGTGYGSVDATAALALMKGERFLEDSVSTANVTDVHYVQVPAGQAELKVTLAWDDLPGTPNADHSVPQLVNDLDLLLLGPNGEVLQPLVLPPATQFDCDGGTAGIQTGCANPGADPGPWPSATTAINAAAGTDRLNNLEQVVFANPAPGLWQVRVSVLNANGSVRLPQGGTQSYSLAGVGEQRADLSVTKTATPNPVMSGEELIYTVTVTNHGPDTAEGVVVVDTLPTEVIFLGADAAGCTYSAATHQVTCPLGDIAGGSSRSFQIKVLVKADTVVGQASGHKDITNTVTVSSTTPDLNTANNTFVRIAFAQDRADLQVTKVCAPIDHQQAGMSATCTIYVDNLGPSYARSVVLTDSHTSDGAFTITGTTTSAGACAAASGVVTCNLGNLANKSPTNTGRATVTVTVSANEDVDVNDVATVTSATPDPNLSNNTVTAAVQFEAVADLGLTKSGPADAIAGTDIVYTLTATNHGPSTATGVTIRDQLPTEVTVVSVVCSNGGSANAGQPGNPLVPTTCTFGNLASGASRTMTVTAHVKPDVLGVISNNARVDGDQFDQNSANDLASVHTTVTGQADLSITKTDSPDPVLAGNPLSYTITVTNGGPSTALAVEVTDTLPAGTTFVSGEDGTGATACALVVPGTVVCALGTLAPGASASVYLKVAVAASLDPDTVLTNTATVTSSTFDPDLTNNTASTGTTVNTQADVWLDKQGERRSGNPSNLVIYTLVVHNDAGCETDAQSTPTPTCGEGGPSDARNIVVTDQLPLDAKKFVVQYISPQCAYTKGTHTVTCTSAVVPAGASVTFVIEGQISGSVGTISNTATVTASTTDPDAANNTNAVTLVHQGGTGGKGGGGGNGGGGKK